MSGCLNDPKCLTASSFITTAGNKTSLCHWYSQKSDPTTFQDIGIKGIIVGYK